MKNKALYLIIIYVVLITSVNADVLYENGPLITSSGTGVNGEDESILQFASLGMTLRGFSNQTRFDNRLADDFTIKGDDWDIDTITLYSFVTNTTTPTITEAYLQIWDGVPGANGSQIIFGDLSTNRLNTSLNTHILRVIEADSGISDERQISANIIDVNFTLSAGTYWLDWSFEGTSGFGPYAPPITITGHLTTGNALQFNNNKQWGNANDFGSETQQGFPFIIENSLMNSIFKNSFEIPQW